MKNHILPTKIDLSKCIIWQYEDAKNLQAVIKMIQDGIEMASVDFWKKTFNAIGLDTPIVEGSDDYLIRIYGLTALSNLFGVSRPSYFESGTTHTVSINAWRIYLKAMIWLMDSDGSCADINEWLKQIFGDNIQAYVIDNHDMTISYSFSPRPEGELAELLKVDGFLPHPAGVLIGEDVIPRDSEFGFEGRYIEWWLSGNSYTEGDVIVHSDNGVHIIYECVEANSDEEWDSDKWTAIPEWTAGSTYVVGDTVLLKTTVGSKAVYRCNTENNDDIFDLEKWDYIQINKGQLNYSRFNELQEQNND